jgi:hypothetical protein
MLKHDRYDGVPDDDYDDDDFYDRNDDEPPMTVASQFVAALVDILLAVTLFGLGAMAAAIAYGLLLAN